MSARPNQSFPKIYLVRVKRPSQFAGAIPFAKEWVRSSQDGRKLLPFIRSHKVYGRSGKILVRFAAQTDQRLLKSLVATWNGSGSEFGSRSFAFLYDPVYHNTCRRSIIIRNVHVHENLEDVKSVLGERGCKVSNIFRLQSSTSNTSASRVVQAVLESEERAVQVASSGKIILGYLECPVGRHRSVRAVGSPEIALLQENAAPAIPHPAHPLPEHPRSKPESLVKNRLIRRTHMDIDEAVESKQPEEVPVSGIDKDEPPQKRTKISHPRASSTPADVSNLPFDGDLDSFLDDIFDENVPLTGTSTPNSDHMFSNSSFAANLSASNVFGRSSDLSIRRSKRKKSKNKSKKTHT